jgi:hypothetical protein
MPFSRHVVPGYYRDVPGGTDAILRCHSNTEARKVLSIVPVGTGAILRCHPKTEVRKVFSIVRAGTAMPYALFPALGTGLTIATSLPGRMRS